MSIEDPVTTFVTDGTKDPIKWADARWRFCGSWDDIAIYGNGRPVILLDGKQIDDAQLIYLIRQGKHADKFALALQKIRGACESAPVSRWWGWVVSPFRCARLARRILRYVKDAVE